MSEITIKKLKTINKIIYQDIRCLLLELYPNKEPLCFGSFKKTISKDNISVFVAIDNKKSIGMASLAHYEKLGGKIAVIEDVVVSEKYRGKGIGSKLTNQLLEYAKNKGCGCVDVNTRREPAKTFYIKKGFAEKNKDRDFYALRYYF